MFIIKKITPEGIKYVKNSRYASWTRDIQEARVFKRRCDAKNCNAWRDIGGFGAEIIEGKLFEPNFKRPAWDNYFLGLAHLVSRRSHDEHTQHGTVIVNPHTHQILGCGYNGFPRGMDDSSLPTSRPEKYKWMIHSEINACSNCFQRLKDTVAYITGEPCNPCIVHLWQNGVKEIVYDRRFAYKDFNDEVLRQREIIMKQTQLSILGIVPDLSWLSSLYLKM